MVNAPKHILTMKRMYKRYQHIIYSLCIIVLYTSPLNAQINVNSAYIGESLKNFSGGIQTGQTCRGIIDFSISFNTKDLGLWNNG